MNNNEPTNQPNGKMSRGWKIFFWAIAILFILFVIGNIDQSKPDQSAAIANPPTTAKPSTPAIKSWQTVATLSGDGNKRSEVFHLNGGTQRLTYTVAGQYSPMLYVYVMAAGTTLEKDGGFAEVTGSTNGDTMLYKSAGDYYLDATSAGATWTVTVDELRE